MEAAYHDSVFQEAAVRALVIDPSGTYVDGTLGGGGHAEAICAALASGGRCVGVDCDEDAIRFASQRLERFRDRVTILRTNFRRMRVDLEQIGIRHVHGVLLDLGVSSFQLDTRGRGFSFREDAPLDMRMDRRQGLRAQDIVNGYAESDLADLLFRFGEERQARRIARAIVSRRPLATTGELRAAVEQVVGQKFLTKSLARVFQAIRIEVNRELDNLAEALRDAAELLEPGGRLVVISYHSLEDRIVKHFFRDAAARVRPSGNKLVPDIPLRPQLRILSAHPVEPTATEVAGNPRARSARMRYAEKLSGAGADGDA